MILALQKDLLWGLVEWLETYRTRTADSVNLSADLQWMILARTIVARRYQEVRLELEIRPRPRRFLAPLRPWIARRATRAGFRPRQAYTLTKKVICLIWDP